MKRKGAGRRGPHDKTRAKLDKLAILVKDRPVSQCYGEAGFSSERAARQIMAIHGMSSPWKGRGKKQAVKSNER